MSFQIKIKGLKSFLHGHPDTAVIHSNVAAGGSNPTVFHSRKNCFVFAVRFRVAFVQRQGFEPT